LEYDAPGPERYPVDLQRPLLAVGYLLTALICFLLIVTIPFGFAALRIASYALWPFGRTIIDKPNAGTGTIIGNIQAGLELRAAGPPDERDRRPTSPPKSPSRSVTTMQWPLGVCAPASRSTFHRRSPAADWSGIRSKRRRCGDKEAGVHGTDKIRRKHRPFPLRRVLGYVINII
jgi:hypothetical protein